jgi:hypothetical protein
MTRRRRWYNGPDEGVATVKASIAGIFLVAALAGRCCFGYSVLTHQAIIDSTWPNTLQPLLQKRFPSATANELRDARAFCYGGSIVQDLGYYPFGNKFFSDLTHYVRSGDFVAALVREAYDINEYAFALGALAHYAADNTGHPLAVNRAVVLVYPELRARFGDTLTYADKPSAHLKTEFGFDVLQVARGNYAPEDYHDRIGFKVAKDVLERAFERTYAFELDDLFLSLDLALGTYRYAVAEVIPKMTRAAWQTKKEEILRHRPQTTAQGFIYRLSRRDYEREWGAEYLRPGFFARVLAFFSRILPRFGPLKSFSFRPLTIESERLFVESVAKTVTEYQTLLRRVGKGELTLQNLDSDTGRPARAGEYRLADEAYHRLLDRLAEKKFAGMPPELRQNILDFYSNLNAAIATKERPKKWAALLLQLQELKRCCAI